MKTIKKFGYTIISITKYKYDFKRNYKNNSKDVVYNVAIGNFDGIHLGHRFILNQLKSCKKSNKDKIAVVTFYPHPVKILNPGVWKKFNKI